MNIKNYNNENSVNAGFNYNKKNFFITYCVQEFYLTFFFYEGNIIYIYIY